MIDNNFILVESIFQYQQQFSDGSVEVKDDGSPGRHVTAKTEGKCEKTTEIVRKNRCLSILMNAVSMNVNKETVRQIPHGRIKHQKRMQGLFQNVYARTRGQPDKSSHIMFRLTGERVFTSDET